MNTWNAQSYTGLLIAVSVAFAVTTIWTNVNEKVNKTIQRVNPVSIPVHENVESILTPAQAKALIEENAKLRKTLSEIKEPNSESDIWWTDSEKFQNAAKMMTNEDGTLHKNGFHEINVGDFREL